MEHTPTPWYCDGDGVYSNEDCEGAPLAHVLSMGYDNDFRNIDARRIVACVNACADLDTEKLEYQNAQGVPLWMFAQDLSRQKEYLTQQLKEERAVWSAKRAELLRNHAAELVRRKTAEAQIDELQPQLYAERASLVAESQRKQQLEQQVCMLLGALELLLCDVEEAECMTGREREAEARAVIQKVRGGEWQE